MNFYMCVERESLEHMKLWKPLCWAWSSKAHEKIKLKVLGIIPGAFQVGAELKLRKIGSLVIVSLGVSYKYILALRLSKEQGAMELY